ncbi:SNF2 family N-terminal domain-containing protein [Xylariaceae sp. FL1272]|nr:SNF2 family N-terminal domain-containing protein [Xylariaceae sp. FL1272]
MAHLATGAKLKRYPKQFVEHEVIHSYSYQPFPRALLKNLCLISTSGRPEKDGPTNSLGNTSANHQGEVSLSLRMRENEATERLPEPASLDSVETGTPGEENSRLKRQRSEAAEMPGPKSKRRKLASDQAQPESNQSESASSNYVEIETNGKENLALKRQRSESPGMSAPKSKRSKLVADQAQPESTQAQPDTVHIIQECVTISRPVGDRPAIILDRENPIDHKKVQQFLALKYDHDQNTLAIHSKPGSSPCNRFWVTLHLSRGLSSPVRAALEIFNATKEDSGKECALWVTTTISVDEADGMVHLKLLVDVKWNVAANLLRNMKERIRSQPIVNILAGSKAIEARSDLADNNLLPQEFYEAAFMPDSEAFSDLDAISIPGLVTTLYPFQRRALQWLLMREGVKLANKYYPYNADGTILLEQCSTTTSMASLPLSFRILKDINGKEFYFSELYHAVATDLTPFRLAEDSFRGGILAEEMGLGKTVEIISLILANKRGLVSEPQSTGAGNTTPTNATLIIAPDALQNQWLTELKQHAPGLRVMRYPGMVEWVKQVTSSDRGQGELLEPRLELQLLSQLGKYDVVITSLSVLRSEVHHAKPPPDRSSRQKSQHERPISPLVKLGWWRVCLDEAQQIPTGVSQTAKLARIIPRINAWSVTGTPVKDNLHDLRELLSFLRYGPFDTHNCIWKAMLHSHKSLFTTLFRQISLRHAKRAVRNELELPPQKRFVVTMPFTAIEEHHYRVQFEAFATRAGLDITGSPLEESVDPAGTATVTEMRGALASLRQMILHPELGVKTYVAGSTYKTLIEHLEALIEKSEAQIQAEQRKYFATKLSRGQLFENSPRVGEALSIWQEVQKEIAPIVGEYRDELRKALEIDRQEKTKIDRPAVDDSSVDEDVENVKVGECRRNLRSILDIEHRATFLIASGCFQKKSDISLTVPDSDVFKELERCEVEGYEKAKQIRKEILREPLAKASMIMDKLRARADTQSFVEIPEIVPDDTHGLESMSLIEDLQSVSASLNEQANLIDEWREHVIQLLLKPLVDGEDDAELTGEEYDDSTKIQDHLMIFTLALRAVICDRQDALSGLTNERIAYETAAAERMAKDGDGHAPEKMLECLELRKDHKLMPGQRPLRAILSGLRQLAAKFRQEAANGSDRAKIELKIITRQLHYTQEMFNEHNKICVKLERELDFFTSAMNLRVDFYRQLQSLSDSVAPLPDDVRMRIENRFEVYKKAEEDTKKKIRNARSQHRHLLLIREEEGQGAEDRQPCLICVSGFTCGILTECGHRFCKECLMHWFKAKRNCPVCKKQLTADMLLEFNRKQLVLKLRHDQMQGTGNSDASSQTAPIYSNFGEDKLRAIQDIKLKGPSYSTKIDTLIKHLKWLRDEDPGAKSIIFSQFQGFLDVLEQALIAHGIGHAAFTTTSSHRYRSLERFREDPDTVCLLMSAKAHSSGLNLVNASHVFLCEPLLNTALELQAIARVDRIGQETETTVWLYLVEGTVEESIYNLSVRRRMAHMGAMDKGKGKGPETQAVSTNALEAANSREMEQVRLARLLDKRVDGEIVEDRDLWGCLFGEARKIKDDGMRDALERYPNTALTRAIGAEAVERRMVLQQSMELERRDEADQS